MTLRKNFLHKEPDFIRVSRFRLIVGGILGLLYSFSFYSFLYIIRETFRLLSVTEKYDLWVLTDNEVCFYNLFFAFLSVIFGQSVCFVFWFDKPKKIFGIRNYRKTTIVHEQRFFNWYFLSWFSKLAIGFGLFFGFSIHGSWHAFSLFPVYNFLFILIIIVLFFQSWNTLRLTYIRKSLMWLFASIILVSALSFGLSKINLTNYNAINESILSNNIQYQYKLDLPASNIYEKSERLSLIEDIYIVCAKEDSLNSKPIIIVGKEKISLDSLPVNINYWRSARFEADVPFMIYRLFIHRDIRMDFINKLKNKMSNSRISSISYAVIPSNSKYINGYDPEVSFPARLSGRDSKVIKVAGIEQDINKIPNIIEIRQSRKGIISVNNNLVDKRNLKIAVKKLIINNPDCLIKYYFNDSLTFSSYLTVVSESTKAVHELRAEYAQREFSQKYDLLNYNEQQEIITKYPIRIIEFTE